MTDPQMLQQLLLQRDEAVRRGDEESQRQLSEAIDATRARIDEAGTPREEVQQAGQAARREQERQERIEITFREPREATADDLRFPVSGFGEPVPGGVDRAERARAAGLEDEALRIEAQTAGVEVTQPEPRARDERVVAAGDADIVSGNVVEINGEFVTAESFERLRPEAQERLRTMGVDAFIAEQRQRASTQESVLSRISQFEVDPGAYDLTRAVLAGAITEREIRDVFGDDVATATMDRVREARTQAQRGVILAPELTPAAVSQALAQRERELQARRDEFSREIGDLERQRAALPDAAGDVGTASGLITGRIRGLEQRIEGLDQDLQAIRQFQAFGGAIPDTEVHRLLSEVAAAEQQVEASRTRVAALQQEVETAATIDRRRIAEGRLRGEQQFLAQLEERREERAQALTTAVRQASERPTLALESTPLSAELAGRAQRAPGDLARDVSGTLVNIGVGTVATTAALRATIATVRGVGAVTGRGVQASQRAIQQHQASVRMVQQRARFLEDQRAAQALDDARFAQRMEEFMAADLKASGVALNAQERALAIQRTQVIRQLQERARAEGMTAAVRAESNRLGVRPEALLTGTATELGIRLVMDQHLARQVAAGPAVAPTVPDTEPEVVPGTPVTEPLPDEGDEPRITPLPEWLPDDDPDAEPTLPPDTDDPIPEPFTPDTDPPFLPTPDVDPDITPDITTTPDDDPTVVPGVTPDPTTDPEPVTEPSPFEQPSPQPGQEPQPGTQPRPGTEGQPQPQTGAGGALLPALGLTTMTQPQPATRTQPSTLPATETQPRTQTQQQRLVRTRTATTTATPARAPGFRLPDGERMRPGEWPLEVGWVQGTSQLRFNLQTGAKQWSDFPGDGKGISPRETFRVLSTTNVPPKVRTRRMGAVNFHVTREGLDFSRADVAPRRPSMPDMPSMPAPSAGGGRMPASGKRKPAPKKPGLQRRRQSGGVSVYSRRGRGAVWPPHQKGMGRRKGRGRR